MKKLLYYILCVLICCALCIDYGELIFPEINDYARLDIIDVYQKTNDCECIRCPCQTKIAIDKTEIPLMYLGNGAKMSLIPVKTGLKYKTIKY